VLSFAFLLSYICINKDTYFQFCNYINVALVCKELTGSDKNTFCYSVISLAMVSGLRDIRKDIKKPFSEGPGNIPYMVMPDTHPGSDAKGKTPIGCC